MIPKLNEEGLSAARKDVRAIFDNRYELVLPEQDVSVLLNLYVESAIRAYLAKASGWRTMTETISLPLRRNRAMSVTHQILHVIKPFIRDGRERDCLRDAHRALFDFLYGSGADVVTDADRKEAGLQPRDEHGLTAHEMQILEAKRIEAMLRPMPPMIFPPPHPKDNPNV